MSDMLNQKQEEPPMKRLNIRYRLSPPRGADEKIDTIRSTPENAAEVQEGSG